jgi:hypothetical protein
LAGVRSVIDESWLTERGGLHDARVVAVSEDGNGLSITIDDELSNDLDDNHLPRAGTLIFQRWLMVEGDTKDASGGWISEIVLSGEEIILDFCDRPRLIIRAARVEWWG